jgi:hypothetical protein
MTARWSDGVEARLVSQGASRGFVQPGEEVKAAELGGAAGKRYQALALEVNPFRAFGAHGAKTTDWGVGIARGAGVKA